MVKKPVNKYISWLGRLFGGFFYGFFAWLPFFQCKTLAEAFGVGREYNDSDTFTEKMKKSLKGHVSVIIGACVGAFFFFLIPVQYLLDGYPFGINCALLVLALVFLVSEIYKYFTSEVKGHNISSIVWLVIIIALFACTYYFDIGSLITEFNSTTGYILMLLMFFIAGYFLAWSGQSLGSVFLLTALYLPFAEYMFPITRLEGLTDNIVLILCCFVGALLGVFIAFFIEATRGDLKKEKSATNIAFSLLGVVILAMRTQQSSFYTGISTELAELMTNLSMILAALVIAVVTTIHVYRRANKEEIEAEYENSVAAPVQPEPLTLEEYHKSLLLEDIFVEDVSEDEEEQQIILDSPKILVDYDHPEDPLNKAESKPVTVQSTSSASGGIDVERLKSLQARISTDK